MPLFEMDLAKSMWCVFLDAVGIIMTIYAIAIVLKWELDKRMDCEAQSVAITVPAITIFSWHISDTTRPKFDNLCSFGFSVSSHNSWLNQTLLKRGTRIFHINQKLKTFKKTFFIWLDWEVGKVVFIIRIPKYSLAILEKTMQK